MGYAVKHSTSNVDNTFRKGDVVLGVSSDGYEDTDTSGLYAGVPPVAGKHNLVITSAIGDPDFYSVDDDGLILLSRNLGGYVESVDNALLFLSQQDNIAFTDQLPKDEVTRGLVLDLRANNRSSYPQQDDFWYDLLKTPASPISEVVNLAYPLTNWKSVTRSTVTEITDGSIPPPYPGARVFSSTRNDSVYGNTLHRMWNNGNSYGVIGELNQGYYRYYMWVRGASHNNPNCAIEIDISDGGANSGPILIGTGSEWQLISVWDNSTGGNYNATEFFDYLFKNGSDSDTYYISGITVARYNVPNSGSLTPLYGFPGNIDYQDTGSLTQQGVLLNGASWDTKGYFNLDGSNDYIKLGTSTNLWTNDFTINYTVKSNTIANQFIFSSGPYTNSGGAGINAWFGGGSSSNFSIHFPRTDSALMVGYNFTLPKPYTNQFHNYQITYVSSSRSLSLYQDGELTETKTVSTSANTSYMDNGWELGRAFGSYYVNGSTSELKIHNEALTQEEVLQNYYGGPIVTDGLVLAVDAGNLVSYESGSTINYSLTGSYSGSLTNGTAYTSSNGGNFIFDGTNDQIDFGDVDVLGGASSATWEMWVRPHEYTGAPSTWRSGITTWNDPSSGLGHTWILDLRYRSYYLGFRTTDVGSYPSFAMQGGSSPTHFPDNEWAHYVGTYDGSQAKVYINGELIATASKTGNIASKNANERLKIGVDRSSTAPMSGEIPIVRLYRNKALSADEVLQNYNAQKNRFI
jgi:hypothetical protein